MLRLFESQLFAIVLFTAFMQASCDRGDSDSNHLMAHIDDIQISEPPPFELPKTEQLFDSNGVYIASDKTIYHAAVPAKFQIIRENDQETVFYVKNLMSLDIERFLNKHFSNQKIAHYAVLNKFEVLPEYIQTTESAVSDAQSEDIQKSDTANKLVHIIVSWRRDENRFIWIYKNPDYTPPVPKQTNRNKKDCTSCHKSKSVISNASDSPIRKVKFRKSILHKMMILLQRMMLKKDNAFKPIQPDALPKDKDMHRSQGLPVPEVEK